MNKEQSSNEKYGLLEIGVGSYFDKNLKQKLIVKQNFVEISGDEFKKNATAMILYIYEGGKNRTETTEAFVEYGEKNLEALDIGGKQVEMKTEAVEADFKEVNTND